MAYIQISDIPMAVRRLHDIYKFDSVQTISRFLFARALSHIAPRVIDGDCDDDFDFKKDELESLMNDLPTIHSLQSDENPRDNQQLLQDLGGALGIIMLSFHELGGLLYAALTTLNLDDLEEGDTKLPFVSVSYHDVGPNSYAISWRTSEDEDFDDLLRGISNARVSASEDIVLQLGNKE